MFLMRSLLLAAGVLNLASALSPAQWRSQSIYQVLTDRFATTSGSVTAPCDPADMTYCNGTWTGLINHLDYIQGMGFSAVWISPVPQNADGGYHGYWQQNMYEVNNNFGSTQDLLALSHALHSRGMYLMVDIVTNHVGYNGCRECVDYTKFRPFNDPTYYHPICEVDYDNMTSVVECWIGDEVVALPDLKTEHPTIVAEFSSWIGQMVANYSIDGIRLDSGMEIDVDFYLPFQEAAGVYVMSEIYDGTPSEFCAYQEYTDGPLNFVSYFWITRAFGTTSYGFHELAWGINMLQNECADTTLLGSFMENHDIVRFPSFQPDIVLAQNAIAFTILQDGIPVIYQGQEQHLNGGEAPLNREAIWLSGYNTKSPLYQWIKQINGIRNFITSFSHSFVTYYNTAIYDTPQLMVTRKGNNGAQLITVYTNVGSGPSNQTLELDGGDTGFEPNQYIIDMISCAVYQVDVCGNVTVTIANGLPAALFPAIALKGSSICSQDSAFEIAMPTPAPENLSATSAMPSTSVLSSTSRSTVATSSLSFATSYAVKSSSTSVMATSSQYVFSTSSMMTSPVMTSSVPASPSAMSSSSVILSTSSQAVVVSSASSSGYQSSASVSPSTLFTSSSSAAVYSSSSISSSIASSISALTSSVVVTTSSSSTSSSSSSSSSSSPKPSFSISASRPSTSSASSTSASPSSSSTSSSSKPSTSSSASRSSTSSTSSIPAATSTVATSTAKITSTSTPGKPTSTVKSTSTSAAKSPSTTAKSPPGKAKSTSAKVISTSSAKGKPAKVMKPAVTTKPKLPKSKAQPNFKIQDVSTTTTVTKHMRIKSTPLPLPSTTKVNPHKRSQTTTACGACITAVAVTFTEAAAPVAAGSRVQIVGSDPKLSSWNAQYAIGMTNGTDGVWRDNIIFTPGTVLQYKYVVVDKAGNVQWEADPNHTFTVPVGCTSTATVSSTWQTWAAKV